MVQPNIRIFPLPYISPSKYAELEQKLQLLAKEKKTSITYDFGNQYFEITGRSQQSCDDTSKIIERNLLPHLTTKTVDEYKFQGTFEDFESILSSVNTSPSVSTTPASTPEVTRIKGRPLDLKKLNETNKATSTDESAPAGAYYYDETESDEPESDSDEEFVETFTFAKNVKDPREVLTGLPVNNTKPVDYLRVIGNDTNTECSLIDRRVKIVGTSSDAVKEALSRFRNLQTIFKRRRRDTRYVACVHYPTEAPEFVLYFCNLERYAQKAYVDVLGEPSAPLHVLLPVFKDKSGELAKPKDLLDPVQPNPTQQWLQRQQQQHQMPQEPSLSLDERMRMASLEHKKQAFGNINAGMAPDYQPLWGENKNYVMYPSAQSSTRTQPPAPRNGAPVPPMPKELVEEFPSLPTAAPRVAPKTSNTRRVMRLTNQKASAAVASPVSQSKILREYNFHNIKTALEEGLEGVRGFKGDIKFSAKIGKVLWNHIEPAVQKKFWTYTDLNDRLMSNNKAKPVFNNVTTFSDEIMDRMSSILPPAHSRKVSFEIYANARNQPSLPYQPVVMYMKNQGVVELTKIVTSTNKITEIEWVSLDRKFDFQFLLQTEEKTRMDVKPFNTFINKVAVDPKTRQITFNNVPDFLEVNYILSKQTTTYRIVFPIVAEITRVEKLPLVQQRDSYGYEKMLGDTGKGQIWYEFEVFYSTNDSIFKENQNLQVGKLASWTSESIFAGTQDNDPLVDYIRCLLMMVEKFESALSN
ncbi:hypothetical protein [Parasitella parasitica]|uniref:DUF7905 domain-containing protein n=1 Tax=Parasitella parasitica TaxID=35722 RepID=A0A0B7MZ19_9FUNG|nr:hypothetical protein [Parasitella parasitica]